MNNRELIILSLVEEFDGVISNTDMQKYLFLLSTEQRLYLYDFVPYKYGCFSFQAYHDKRKLEKLGILREENKWCLSDSQSGYVKKLSPALQKELRNFKDKYKNIKGDTLLKYVYKTYPYYAIKSEILDNILDTTEIDIINENRPKNDKTILYNIGYEGKSLEDIINHLIKEDIAVLCDIRKNPISRKYGFSKKTISNALERVGIEYQHFPEIGIDSQERKNLKALSDYQRLFDSYEKTTLAGAEVSINRLFQLLIQKKRIALMCFEKDKQYCHRNKVAHAIMKKVKHENICEKAL